MKKAIIAMCTGTKYRMNNIPAFSLYAAQPWFSIRKYKIDFDFSVYVMSAKYGLIAGNKLIDYYEQKLDKNKALHFKKLYGEEIKKIINEHDMTYLFLSELYKLVLPDDIDKNKVIFMEKGLLKSLTNLKKFITEK